MLSFILHGINIENIQESFILLTGFFAAAIHVLTGPDHLAAVTPLVLEKNKKHWRIGLFWGTGHVLGMLLIGLLFIWFKKIIPIDIISKYSENIVGIILIFIGIWAIYRIYHPANKHIHPHEHSVDDTKIVHIHSHQHNNNTQSHQHRHSNPFKQDELSALGIGMLHGFAGVSHFILMLPVLGLHNTSKAVGYLSGFALGTIAAMIIYTFIIGKFNTLKSKNAHLINDIRFWGGILAIIVGIYWIFIQ